MAVVYFTGFEAGNTSEANATSGTVSVQSTIANNGLGYALRTNPATTGTGSADVIRGLAADGAFAGLSQVDTYLRFYLYVATAPASGDEELLRVSTTKFYLRLNSSGQIVSYDSTPTLLATGSTALSLNTWYRIELYVGTGAAASYEVRINGNTELSGTFSGASNTTGGSLGKVTNRNGNSVDFYFDDLVIDDATWPGAGQCRATAVNADGFYTTGTATGGPVNNWDCVDELPHNSDTDYVLTTGVAGDAYTAKGAPSLSGTVNAVKVGYAGKRDGASGGSLFVRARSASTDSTNAGATVTGTSYVTRQRLLTADPATGVAWTTGGAASCETGVKENSVNQSRVTSAFVMIDYLPASQASAASRDKHFCGPFSPSLARPAGYIA